MDIYTVSFFGHRRIEYHFEVEKKLSVLIKELLTTKPYVEFLVGRDGEFDQIVASTVRKCMRDLGDDHAALVLVLPYMTAEYKHNLHSFHEYYSEVEICSDSSKIHYRGAHQVRNHIMINRSNLVIFCVDHPSGGAYQSMKYAQKVNKEYINVY